MSDKDSVDPIPRSVNSGEARAVGIQLPNDGRMDALSLKFRQESELLLRHGHAWIIYVYEMWLS
jgi:hypothetical protein